MHTRCQLLNQPKFAASLVQVFVKRVLKQRGSRRHWEGWTWWQAAAAAADVEISRGNSPNLKQLLCRQWFEGYEDERIMLKQLIDR